ncbi:MAG: TonB family protein [Rhodocyclaceae bacterium]|jgi:protein TonB|nr:TonB family protein [Rhodocyclaceae bacterium]MBK6906910.1 TonB family protein [Rhodocyclaceae bacterium]
MTYPPPENQISPGLGLALAGSLVVHLLAVYFLGPGRMPVEPVLSPPSLQIALSPRPDVPTFASPSPPAPGAVPLPSPARRVPVSPSSVRPPDPVADPTIAEPTIAEPIPATAQPVMVAQPAQSAPSAMSPVTHSAPALTSRPARTAAVIDAQACRKPDYPPAALRAQEEGEVTLEMLVAVDGTVLESKVLRSSGFRRLDDAARRALALCRFTPGTEAGIAVQSVARIAYLWRIDE